ncbi:MAG TPA: DUF3536 domain-containing protein [Gemmatimonadales bacterium]|jgi:hypothetical protein
MHQVVIHGHFYQPPREEPWLELVPRELSAAPAHDWNERITRECYQPLAAARVLDAHGRIIDVVNAYEWCSFDVGPTLHRWFDRYAPEVGAAFVAGDRASLARTGAGNAMAMPYHHVILPLLSQRDKVTEVRWGIRDFTRRFGRAPEGIWLPETAVDEETLAVVAAAGIRFTVLAPSQVDVVPSFGRPGRWRAGRGHELAIFVYDGTLAHQVAFGDALVHADEWERSLTGMPLARDGAPSVVSIATDGETFGHHHHFGDLALAAVIHRIAKRDDAALTNFAAILRAAPPQHDVAIVSPSSWSCPHGVDRWRLACGCRTEPGTSQEWRVTLRHGLDALHAGMTAAVARRWPRSAGNLWEARDAAGPQVADSADLPADARTLLAVHSHALAMFTSCAWFFDDLGRIEPAIVLRHAARALELLGRDDGMPLEAALIATLAEARSADPAKGDGAEIWRRDVVTGVAAFARLAAGLGAVRALAPDLLDEIAVPPHRWRIEGDEIITVDGETGREQRWRVELTTPGTLPIVAQVRALPGNATQQISATDYPDPIRTALRDVVTPMIYDATLAPDDATLLRAGLIDIPAARRRAVAGAWTLIDRDGIDDAGIVLHAALDLFDADGIAVPDDVRSDGFLRIAPWPASPIREALAERLGVVLDAAH